MSPALAYFHDLGNPMGWRFTLALGVMPLMVAGFLSSALANRLGFVAWSLAAAFAYAASLRYEFETQTAASGRFALPCLALGVASIAHGSLNIWIGSELDMAFRGFFPKFYHPVLTHPGTAMVLGFAFLAGAFFLHFRNRQDPRRSL